MTLFNEGTTLLEAIILCARDDGFLLWDALHRYVEGVVQVAYPSEQVD